MPSRLGLSWPFVRNALFYYGWSGKGDSNPRPSAWEAVKALVRLCPLASARVYFIGSGDDCWVPQTPGIVPLCPSVWLQFGYSAWLFRFMPLAQTRLLQCFGAVIPQT